MKHIEFKNHLITTPQLVFVGLGNITDKYENTRHNVGFDFIDYIIGSNDLPPLKMESKFESYINRYKSNSHDIILAKPTTFMNNSGDAVVRILDYFDLKDENLVVIHDDLDIALGEYKINNGKGPREHNGIIDIENKIDTKDFWRIRIGVEGRTGESKKIPGRNYVLMKLDEECREKVDDVLYETVGDVSRLIF